MSRRTKRKRRATARRRRSQLLYKDFEIPSRLTCTLPRKAAQDVVGKNISHTLDRSRAFGVMDTVKKEPLGKTDF